jgi:lysophospholipase L1-like esterase
MDKGRAQAILFVTVFCVLCLTALELSLRAVVPYNMSLREIMRPSREPGVLYELSPGTRVRFNGQGCRLPETLLEVSSAGMRDREYSVRKPDGAYRIAVMGDSVAFGWGVELEQTFAKRLEQMLNAGEPGGRKYEVINFAVPGYNIAQEVAVLRTKVLAYSPDLVLVCVCGNDNQPSFDYLYPLPFFRHVPGVVFKSRLVRLALDTGSRSILERSARRGEGQAAAEAAVRELSGLAARERLTVIFYPDYGWMETLLGKYGLGGRTVYSDFRIWTPGYVLEKDGHPNAAGHERIAGILYRYLKEHVL